eukprot:m.127910 g.127910  ORF g.127910 m.127910 type:complete len:97 (+) comp16719_c4_seq1:1278-1568(+)
MTLLADSAMAGARATTTDMVSASGGGVVALVVVVVVAGDGQIRSVKEASSKRSAAPLDVMCDLMCCYFVVRLCVSYLCVVSLLVVLFLVCCCGWCG